MFVYVARPSIYISYQARYLHEHWEPLQLYPPNLPLHFEFGQDSLPSTSCIASFSHSRPVMAFSLRKYEVHARSPPAPSPLVAPSCEGNDRDQVCE